jgi:hypothetical protein
MWILSFLPYWIFYAIFFIGVVGYVATHLIRFIPIGALYVYKLPIQIVSILLIALGTYMSGAISNEKEWQLRVKEMEAKVAQSEARSAEENVKIVEKVVVQTQVIRERGNEIIKYIDREVVKYDQMCEVPKEVINILNEAAEGVK